MEKEQRKLSELVLGAEGVSENYPHLSAGLSPSPSVSHPSEEGGRAKDTKGRKREFGRFGGRVAGGLDLGSASLGSNPVSNIQQLCDPRQVT